MEKLSILHINPFFYPFQGGTEKYLLDLSKRLAKKHNVSIITSRLHGTRKYEEIHGIKVYRLESMIFKKLPLFLPPPYSISPGFPLAFKKICDQERVDIIHLHNRFCSDYYSLILLKKVIKKPLFLSLHNARTIGIKPSINIAGKAYDNTIGKIIMRGADRIIANSKWTLDVTLPSDYPKRQAEVIYNGIDTKLYKKVKSNMKEKLGCENYSLTVSRIIPQKGLEYLVKALPYIEGDFKAVVIGKGTEVGKLKKLAKKLKVEKKLHFTGFVPEKDMTKYYSSADVFVLPSLYEPFGIVLLEAMACETPVVAAGSGGIPEVVDKSGIIVKPRNEKQIAKGVNDLLADSKLRKKYAKKGRERAEKVFDWDIIAKQVESSYKKYLGRK